MVRTTQSPSSPKFSVGDLVGSTFPTFDNKVGIVVSIQYFDKNFLEAYVYEVMNEDEIIMLMDSWIYKL